MNDEVNGYIYFNARVLLTEVNFDKSKVKHGGMYIRFDNLLTHFDLDMDAHSLPELYAQTQLNVERYADEITGQIWEICNSLFKIRRLVPNSTDDKYDILVTDDGKAWVNRSLKLYVVGQNSKLSKEELNKKIEQELLKHFDKEVAGISPEFIYTTVVPGLDVR